jgi:protein CMS1
MAAKNFFFNIYHFVLALPTLKVRLAQRPAQKGAPTALVITSAALRAADLARVLRDMKGTKGGDVAKLFAKHFKLEEHAEYLRRTLVSAGVGTPGRLGRLLSETGMPSHAWPYHLCPDKIPPDAISLKALTHIILDVTFQDAKNRTLLDIPETRDPLFKLVLANEGIRAAIASGKIRVVLF